MNIDDRCVCERCDWRGYRKDLLRARNPFALDKAIYGCPQCLRVNTLRSTCQEPGCWDRASFGEWKPGVGWRTHCCQHRPGPKKKHKPMKSLFRSRSSVDK